MSSFAIIVSLTSFAAVAVGILVWLWVSRSNLVRRVERLNVEMLEASKDASVGHRLTIPDDPATGQIAKNVNRLFDALGERDEKIQGRDRLFKDFARTLPEIVIIHDEKILL
ncbi:MAG: hypothetical protein MUO51_16295, partial [Woeseiaceae bacterium]|nr:hypothetical protein [Woeseiaceae bacterium]